MKYYVQRHASGFVGNCLLFWRQGNCGYTCDLDDAQVFDGDDARFQQIARDTSKYTVWEKGYLDACAQRHVDHQRVNPDLKGVKGDVP